MTNQMDELIEKVELWAEVRKLDTADPKAQTLKAIEEFTEMIMAYEIYEEVIEYPSYDDEPKELESEVVDGVGDTYVTLIILCQQIGEDFRGLDFRVVDSDNANKIINRLATSVSKGVQCDIKYAITDMLGVAHYVAGEVDVHPSSCLAAAYNEIKDRKGMMIDGTFVKYDDLSEERKAVLDNA